VAINLAAALGAVTPTVLVDLDCTSPCVAAYLNLDPSLNVCTLAHAIRDDPRAVGYAVSQELQVLHSRVPSAQVVCGLPKRELRPSVTPQVLEKLIAELRRRFRYIVLDIGSELLGMDAPAEVHRAALACADDVILVTAADLVSLWHGRIALAQFARNLGIERDRVSMIINRHDPRYHHSAAEIEWHLGAMKAALVPHDYAGVQRAMMEQRPAVLYPNSKAGRALLHIAEAIHGDKLSRPLADSEPRQRRRWRPGVPAAVAGVLRWSGPA
jgi:Flp pilus assembly CpaE family ATPase